jgi:hypothetical protein
MGKRFAPRGLHLILPILLLPLINIVGLEPRIESIGPRSVVSGSASTIKLTGKHFEHGSKVALILREEESPILVPSPMVQARVSLFGDTVGFETEGTARYLLARGNHLFVGLASGLWILDVSDPTEPVPIRLIPADGTIWGFTMSGDYIYIGSNERGLRYWNLKVVDISNPEEAKPVGWDLFPGAINRISSSGSYLFIGTAGVQVIDVSDPLFPEEIAFLKNPNDTTKILIQGDYAYICRGPYKGFYIADVSDPNRPSVVGYNGEAMYSWHIFSDGIRIFITGDRLYIYDIQNPAEPRLIERYTTNQSITDAAVRDHRVYLVDAEGLKVIDVRDAARPYLSGAYKLSSSRGVHVDDRGYAYVAMGEEGIRVIRLNDPVTDVDVIGTEEIRFQLPTRLSKGTYDVTVTGSTGETALLEAAIKVE